MISKTLAVGADVWVVLTDLSDVRKATLEWRGDRWINVAYGATGHEGGIGHDRVWGTERNALLAMREMLESRRRDLLAQERELARRVQSTWERVCKIMAELDQS